LSGIKEAIKSYGDGGNDYDETDFLNDFVTNAFSSTLPSSKFGFKDVATNKVGNIVNSLTINYMQSLSIELTKQSLRAIEGKEVDSADKIFKSPLLGVLRPAVGDYFGNKLYWRMFQNNINDGIRFPNHF
jgi:hypothetical protein